MTIKMKLRLLMIVALVAIGCGILVTKLGFDAVNEAQAMSHRQESQVRGLTEIKGSALSTIELDPTTDDTKKVFSDAEENIKKWSAVIGPLFTSPDQQERFSKITSQWGAYDQKSRQLIELAAKDAKAANDQVATLYHSDFQPLQALIQEVIEDANKRAKQSDDAATSTSTNAVRTVIVVMLLVLALVVGWILLLSRAIQRSVGGIQGTLHDASQSLDLRMRAPVQTMDEIGQTATAFNHLMERIREVMSTVRESVESVSTASKEIASGNIDLSSRTEQQAASLEETAASMDELTGTVRQNAENARQATGLAHTASGIAERGNQVVSEVVGTMGEMNKSSSKISDIIGIIDGIAFQTNILALNAAVEAARAGEQGRGFAVVAGEVRSLAQRSSVAAKEIKELISASVEQVGAGTRLVDQAGATMQEISTAISRVTALVGEISTASDEQSKGIDQIGQAVTQMDHVTQQNAALVEQAAAAAQSLDDQAARLHAAISVFKL
jgi:methyl-accepting chemotaxis protein